MWYSVIGATKSNQRFRQLCISAIIFLLIIKLFLFRFWILGICSTGTAGLGVLGNVLSIIVLCSRCVLSPFFHPRFVLITFFCARFVLFTFLYSRCVLFFTVLYSRCLLFTVLSSWCVLFNSFAPMCTLNFPLLYCRPVCVRFSFLCSKRVLFTFLCSNCVIFIFFSSQGVLFILLCSRCTTVLFSFVCSMFVLLSFLCSSCELLMLLWFKCVVFTFQCSRWVFFTFIWSMYHIMITIITIHFLPLQVYMMWLESNMRAKLL